MKTTTVLLIPALHLSPVLAWGALGHETIAWIAQNLISTSTTSYVQSILGSSTSDFMANVSTWSDTYRYTSAGHWSAPLHFIDANDNPQTSCSVDFDRDCGDSGCVVSAIVNYTSILLQGSASAADLQDAMKFVIHFVGDIHQPLHDEALDLGGNEINVTWDGDDTNLHHIWDTEIPEAIAGDQSAEAWGKNLTGLLKAGKFGGLSKLTEGMNLNDTQGSAMGWASGSNAYVCSDVLKGGVDAVEEGDLDGSYFMAHEDVAMSQIAIAGYRLGAWLDLIAGSASS